MLQCCARTVLTRLAFLALIISGAAGAPCSLAAEADALAIPYEKHVLANGLTLILHEDHKAPLVAVNIWYHVGSKDERPGRTGFAHLFEHLMFNGSENYNDEFFRPLEPAGATQMNGTTWYDRTNYFQNVPTSALDLTLWLESDRMGHLLGAIDQAKLDEQREVVLNEKRQGENEPYGKVEELIAHSTYPPGHPYSWTTIGSEQDLNAAHLEDVKAWFKENYGAANAVLVIAGDIDPVAVKKKVELYFGDIAPGPTRSRATERVARMQGIQRATMQDRVPQARIYKVWNVPGFCSTDHNLLGLAASVLGSGKNSRLYQRLVYRDRIATAVSVDLGPFEIGSQLMIDAMVAPGQDPAKVEQAIDEELSRFLAKGPTREEMDRVKAGVFADASRSLERVDGFGGKSANLARYQTFCGTPERYVGQLAEVESATPALVTKTAQQWLADGQFVLTVTPFAELSAATSGADRSKLPPLGAPPALKLPPLQHARLSNGLKVALAERHTAPVVQFNLMFDAGYAADAGIKAGTARLALDLRDEGAGPYDALELAARAESLGAKLSAGSNLDTSFINLNALSSALEPSLDLYADVILRPHMEASELERLRQRQLAAIAQEKAQPFGIASRLLTGLLYGASHAYANPLSGTGDEASVRSISVDDLLSYSQRWLRPDNATLLVVGDITLERLMPALEKRFANWRPPSEPRAQKSFGSIETPQKPRIYLINRSDAQQTLILATQLAPPRTDAEDLAMQLANTVLGGLFVSRLNMNLREDKHWAYGASSSIANTQTQRPFFAYASVQTDRTAQAMSEMHKELTRIIGPGPITASEAQFARDSLVRALPGQNETVQDLAQSYTEVLTYGLPDDYWNRYVDSMEGLSLEQVQAATRHLIHPDQLTWIIVGDRSRIEAEIRALNWTPVQILDTDGHPQP